MIEVSVNTTTAFPLCDVMSIPISTCTAARFDPLLSISLYSRALKQLLTSRSCHTLSGSSILVGSPFISPSLQQEGAQGQSLAPAAPSAYNPTLTSAACHILSSRRLRSNYCYGVRRTVCNARACTFTTELYLRLFRLLRYVC